MKKNILVLVFCTLISAVELQETSYALENTIPAEIIEGATKNFQALFPTLKANLELWKTHKDQQSTLESAFSKQDFEAVLKSLNAAKEVDKLFPIVHEQSRSLLGIMANLQKEYGVGKDIFQLLGVEDQMNTIEGDLISFMTHYSSRASQQQSGCRK